jgi:hypothetical protein
MEQGSDARACQTARPKVSLLSPRNRRERDVNGLNASGCGPVARPSHPTRNLAHNCTPNR